MTAWQHLRHPEHPQSEEPPSLPPVFPYFPLGQNPFSRLEEPVQTVSRLTPKIRILPIVWHHIPESLICIIQGKPHMEGIRAHTHAHMPARPLAAQ
ncbi:hypothetical protein LZ32DRAFT_605349 [Colletotrichum eremochloae]|nr:hypothetical protein LZ32DRAFT_605349 [Colletotrichum eremochloae]